VTSRRDMAASGVLKLFPRVHTRFTLCYQSHGRRSVLGGEFSQTMAGTRVPSQFMQGAAAACAVDPW
jgi:hypothetical protein